MSTRLRASALLLPLLLTACQPDDARDAAPADTAAADAEQTVDTPAAPGLAARPGTRRDTVMIEGMAEVQEMTLLRAPAGFRLPFSTYVPEGIRASIEDSVSVRFSAAFGGVENENAYMQVYVYERDTPRSTVRDILQGFLRSRAPAAAETRSVDTPAWALESLGFNYSGGRGVHYAGRALTAEHGGHYFHVIIHYPAEYGDGMAPRLDRVLREWRWEDDGAMLVS